MKKEELIKLLKENIDAFNQYRKDTDYEYINLRYADLSSADLSSADLSYANLSSADLSSANLRYADLSTADLSYANLSTADLSYANLSSADLSDLYFNEATSFYSLACPESGSFDAYKKCKDNIIVKLRIPAKAKRSSATTRKCRAEFVKVLKIYGAEKAVSIHDKNVTYKKGEIIKCHEWDNDRWNECSGGIHFFITKKEAENYF